MLYNKLNKVRKIICITICVLLTGSCSNFLDVVPDDGIARLENAFAMRQEARRYLYTCYSYMPLDGSLLNDPAILSGDEYWSVFDVTSMPYNDNAFRIARGLQNATSPLVGQYWESMYKAIRDCNIFLENVGTVPDLLEWERIQWIAEVKFLKAYYHFYLVRLYGPIPVVRENIPITASPDEVKVSRNTVDECFDYIVELLDEALPDLPPIIVDPAEELGRTTQSIAAALKAKVLVTAASPLFNNNSDQTTLVNRDGTKLFPTGLDPDAVKAKWDSAVVACRRAIEICHAADHALHQYQTLSTLSDTIKRQLTVRTGFTEKWNSGIIWSNSQTRFITQTQQCATPNLDAGPGRFPDTWTLYGIINPVLKIAEMYYTDNGVPIEEDKNWQNLDPFALRTGTDAEAYYIKKDYTTIQLHFDREQRFYASLGFDGGIWYGQRIYGNNPNEYMYISCRIGGIHQKRMTNVGPVTGYYWKKCIHFENVQTALNSYSMTMYPWPLIRLADLYLLYAEAINEAEGPNGANSGEMFRYIDMVRENAGLKGVKESWDNYALSPKYNSKEGMQQIIRRERLIELSLEGQRFWDLRRWKTAPEEYGKGIKGYKILESDPAKFYQPVLLFDQKFAIKDYFWPIQTGVIENNRNIVQNIGW
ncbi:MAG: RagB/SusD family nutrient uptake outer membrane protein [Prevotellaceae bacterium]|nr:RagB/SusD family nutrient uptake outer membrane protein [Prevotellaceae bacterium]